MMRYVGWLSTEINSSDLAYFGLGSMSKTFFHTCSFRVEMMTVMMMMTIMMKVMMMMMMKKEKMRYRNWTKSN